VRADDHPRTLAAVGDQATGVTIQDKIDFFTRLYPQIKGFAHATTMGAYGDFWRARRKVGTAFSVDAATKTATVFLSIPDTVSGLTLRVPQDWTGFACWCLTVQCRVLSPSPPVSHEEKNK
jgi:hypothetical protein